MAVFKGISVFLVMCTSLVAALHEDPRMCGLCPKNSWCFENALNACPTHQIAPNGSDARTDCACKPGYYFDATACTICPVNSYCPGNRSRVACPQYATAELEGHDSFDDCLCNAGHYLLLNHSHSEDHHGGYEHSECEACAKGKYKSSRGSTPCVSCLAGKFSNVSGSANASSCRACPLGTYQSAGSASACHACSINSTTVSVGARQDNLCVCPPGHARDDVQDYNTPCRPCAPGRFKNGNNHNQCDECSPGFYSDVFGADTCSACPDGRTSESGTSSVDDCLCLAGNFKAVGAQNASGCAPCVPPLVRLTDTEADAACDVCPGGRQYVNATQCTTCPEGEAVGAATCLCLPGWQRIATGQPCTPCPEGAVQNATGDNRCTSCPANNYIEDERCHACHAHSTQTPGVWDGQFDACVCDPGYYFCKATTTTYNFAAFEGDSQSGNDLPSTLTTYFDVHNIGYSLNYWNYGDRCDSSTTQVMKGSDLVGFIELTLPDIAGTVSVRVGANMDNQRWVEILMNGAVQHTVTTCDETWTGSFSGGEALRIRETFNSIILYSISVHGTCVSSGCEACEAGKYRPGSSNNESCVACPTGKTSPPASSASDDCACAPGWTGASGGTCERCPPGTFKPGPGAHACTPCAVGFFAEEAGSLTCTSCAETAAVHGANTTLATGSRFSDNCTCYAGHFTARPSGGESACTRCPAGSYNLANRTDDPACERCSDSGLYHRDAVTLTLLYEDFFDNPRVLDVPRGVPVTIRWPEIVGTVHPVLLSSTGAREQTTDFAQTQIDDTTTTFVVPLWYPGELYYYCSSHGGMGIHPVALYDPAATRAGACASCPAPEVIDPGAEVPLKTDCVCPPGFEFNTSYACSPCPGLRVKHTASDTDRCLPCDGGHFFFAHHERCGICNMSTMSIYPYHSNSGPDAASRADCTCDAGYEVHTPGETCRACPEGSVSHASGMNCSLCPLGTFQNNKAQTTCLSCPVNHTTATPGAEEDTDCVCAPGFEPLGDLCLPCPSGFASQGYGHPCRSCGWGTVSTPGAHTCNQTSCDVQRGLFSQ